MSHMIKNNLYKVVSEYGVPHYVEAENEEDLFRHVIDNVLFKGIYVSKIYLIEYDNSKSQVSLSSELFKKMLRDRLNKPKGKLNIAAKDQELLRKMYCC